MKLQVLCEHDGIGACFLEAERIFDELLQALASSFGGDFESLEFVLGIACIGVSVPSKNS